MSIKNLKIGQKLMFSFATVIALMLALSTLSYTRIVDLADDITLTNSDRYPKVVLAHTIKDKLNETARNMRNILLMTDAEVIKKEFANIDESGRIITEALAKLDKSVTSVKGREMLKSLTEARERFVTQRTAFLPIAREGKKEEAITLLMGGVRTTQLAYFVELDKLIAYQEELMVASGKESAAAASQALKAGDLPALHESLGKLRLIYLNACCHACWRLFSRLMLTFYAWYRSNGQVTLLANNACQL